MSTAPPDPSASHPPTPPSPPGPPVPRHPSDPLAPPGPPPEPPPDLASRDIETYTLAAGTILFRIHPLRYAHRLLYFGRRSEGRFNAPAGEFGVLYGAFEPHTAFLETFGREVGLRIVSASDLDEACLVRLRVVRPVRLANLTGPSLRRLGADTRVTSGDHRAGRAWSLALWQHPARPDGLRWRSRFDDNRFCVALYDHAEDALHPENLGTLISPAHRTLLANILDTYDFALT